ncbi:protein CASC3-like isoform X2 [Daphnia pulicaria]|uniref:protein CASC3-like isoform X2 n=1 Tax=Daphnia pulicaria TaxID=35523 RepID=UPI001EE9F397|nr:protein CASC3-like isoform X2 [Daphnia pulicaria]
MADDDSRRGVTSVADADSAEQSTNSGDNPQAESKAVTDDVAVASQPTEVTPEDKTIPDTPKASAEVITSATRDSEETKNRLAKAREELNKAREESARARDEVEKAKKDLAVAKQDTSSTIQVAVEKPSAEVNVAASESTPKVETEIDKPSKAEEAPAVTEHVENSKKEEKPEIQPETPKEEKLVPEDSKNSNQNCEATEPNEEVGEDKPVTAHESQSAVETKTVEEEAKVEDTVVTADNSNATKEIQVESNKEVETPVGATEEVQEESHVEEKQPESSKDEEGEIVEGENEEGENEEGELVEDEEGEEVEGEHEEEEVVEGEREEGDGEESDDEDAPAKPLDDDEDRRNPQYIPKRGGFYEHDDRNREEVEEAAAEEPVAGVEVEKPKKTRSEAIDRWGHDMFDPNQQVPKSDQELVDLYGYDIRQEEGAPRARRRRRYGRGPNKYDRTWEDEDAYSRPRGRGGVASRGGPSERGSGFERNPDSRPRTQRQEMPKKDEFPALSDGKQEPKAQGETAPKQSSQSNWREGERGIGMTGGNERRGGGNSNNSNNSKANAVSYRRGGGGRTFEERREMREAKGLRARSDSVPQSGEGDEEQSADQPPKENIRSPRRPMGGEASPRGAPRGGSSRGTGNRGGAMGYSGPPRGGASPRGRGAITSRGRRNDNPNWNRGDEEGGNSRPGPPHQPFNRGPGASQDVRMDHRGPFEEPRGRGRGKFGRPMDGNADQAVVGGMEQMRIEDHSAPRNQDAARSKRYSSQRQRMTTPPPANAGAAPIQQPPYPVAAGGSAAYYASYNDSPPPNYVSAAPAPLLPMAVAAQGAPPTFITQPIYPAGPGPAPFNAGPYQGYPPAPAPPTVPVGVPIGSPTQDYMYGGGTMYYDPGRQPIRHGNQPTRRAKAAIPIVAPDNEVDSYLISGRRLNHE